MSEQNQQTDPQLVNAVLQSKQSIVQTYQDVLKGAQASLIQAQTNGNRDSMMNAKEQVAKAQALQYAEISLANASQLARG